MLYDEVNGFDFKEFMRIKCCINSIKFINSNLRTLFNKYNIGYRNTINKQYVINKKTHLEFINYLYDNKHNSNKMCDKVTCTNGDTDACKDCKFHFLYMSKISKSAYQSFLP